MFTSIRHIAVHGLFVIVVCLPAFTADAGVASRHADFNGDGFDDLAIGVPGENVGGVGNAGAVNVIYGTGNGLRAKRDQFWSLNSDGLDDGAEQNDHFGSALAWGDFDHDGFTDLAIGISNRDINGVIDAGAVRILYGTANGLSADRSQLWSLATSAVLGSPQTQGQFGWSLAVGDFDGNGYDDLAIGAIGESVGLIANAGAVHVLYGAIEGLRAFHNQQWTQDSSFITDSAEQGDLFGWALAAGDFDHDGRDDLAIGIPNEDLGLVVNAGVVEVIYGSLGGLNGAGDQLFSRETLGIAGSAGDSDSFGYALAAGDFNGDTDDDLAIGVPFDGGGAVHVLYGNLIGLTTFNDQVFRKASFDDGGDLEAGAFGVALAAGDFDGDGNQDLVIGAPLDDSAAGAVRVMYGDENGLDPAFSERWTQDSPSIHDQSEPGDRFGSFLSLGDFDGNGAFDLVIGAPLEDVAGAVDAGAVNIIYGFGNGLSGVNDQVWTQNSPAINGISGAGDRFGSRIDSLLD